MNQTITNTLSLNALNPQLSTLNHPPRQRWGTVAELPARIRNWLNKALRDGLTYTQILDGLKKRRCDHLNRKHIARWKRTGYADWLAEQQHTEALRLRIDAIAASTHKTSRTSQKSVRENADMNIAIKLLDVIKAANVDDLRNLLNDKPENFFRLIRAHAVQERNAIMRDRYQLELKKHADKEKKQKRASAPKKIPSRMDIERYKRDLNIVPAEYQPIEYGGKAPATRAPLSAPTPDSPTTPVATQIAVSHSAPQSQISNLKSEIRTHPASTSQTTNSKSEPLEPDYTDPYHADRIPFEI